MANYNNKRAVETFLVQKTAGVAVVADGTTLLIDSANSKANLAEGQLGIFDASGTGSGTMYTSVAASPTTAQSPIIQIIQGTAGSVDPSSIQNKYPLWTRPYEASGEINGRNGVTVTKQVYDAPTHSTWVIGAPVGTTGAFAAADSTEFGFTVAYRGRHVEEFYGGEQAASFAPSFITPDYTTLGTVNSLDHMIQNLLWDVNRNSYIVAPNRTRFTGNDPIIGFTINSGAGGNLGNTTGTLVSSLTAGTVIAVVNTQYGTRNVTLTQDMATSVISAITAYDAANTTTLTTTARITTIDLTTAGAVVGTTTGSDMFMLVALDRVTSFDDRIPQVKTRLKIGMTLGFDYTTTYHDELVYAYEGQGVARTLELQFQATHNQRKYSLNHRQVPVIKFPSDIDLTAQYDTYVIEHAHSAIIDTVGNTSVSPAKEIILFPTGDASEAAFDTAIDSWLVSGNNGPIQS